VKKKKRPEILAFLPRLERDSPAKVGKSSLEAPAAKSFPEGDGMTFGSLEDTADME
jgi:hypothetical protein